MGIIETEYWGRKLKCDCGKKVYELHVIGKERLCDECFKRKDGINYQDAFRKLHDGAIE